MNDEISVNDAIKNVYTMEEERKRVQPEPPEQPRSPLVIFMTPALDHKVSLGFVRSFFETLNLLNQNGIAVGLEMRGGDPYLAKVRNVMVSVALKKYPTATHLFFVDSDEEWNKEAVLRMVTHPADVIAGLYPQKKDELNFPASVRMAEPNEAGELPELPEGQNYVDCWHTDPQTGEKSMRREKLIEWNGAYLSEMVPTGFLCIRREVYAKMAEQSPRYKDGTSQGEICWNFYEMGFDPTTLEKTGLGEWWGEDFAFCRRLLNSGHSIWVDPNIDFGHMGTKTWTANFGHALQAVIDGTAQFRDPPAEAEAPPPLPAARQVLEEALGDNLARASD